MIFIQLVAGLNVFCKISEFNLIEPKKKKKCSSHSSLHTIYLFTFIDHSFGNVYSGLILPLPEDHPMLWLWTDHRRKIVWF